MSTPQAGLDQFAATVAILDDGDNRDAASVAVPLEGILDRTTWLRNRQMGAIAQNWTRYTFSMADANRVIAINDGIAREAYLVWTTGENASLVVYADGQTRTPTGNGYDIFARASHAWKAFQIAVEVPSNGLHVELTGDGAANWFGGDALPANTNAECAAWCQADTLDTGAFVIAAQDVTDDSPWVHVYNASSGVRVSSQLSALATAGNQLSAIAVGGIDFNHVIVADDSQYWISTEAAGDALAWTRYDADWGDGVKISWSLESGWVAVWQGSDTGEFSWASSPDGITWSTPVTVSLPYTDASVGDVILGGVADGNVNQVECFKVLRYLWVLWVWDRDTPRQGLKFVYSVDQGSTWKYYGVPIPSVDGAPCLAVSASGFAAIVENSIWISHRVGSPRFGA